MKKTLAALLICISCAKAPAPVQVLVKGAVPAAPGPGLQNVTWAGSPVVPMDGGAVTYTSDPIIMGGYVGAHVSAASVSCIGQNGLTVPSSGALSVNFSNDNVLWWPSGITPSTIDGGVGDGGTPAEVIVAATPVPLAALVLTGLTTQTFDAGFFCDAGVQGVSIIGECDAGIYSSYIDAGTNFCDGGNFCDAGPNSYLLSGAQSLACTVNTVPQ